MTPSRAKQIVQKILFYCFILFVIMLIIALLTGCATPCIKPEQDNVLITTECPEDLGILVDNSFGATTMKLTEVVTTYQKCRQAALGKNENKESANKK